MKGEATEKFIRYLVNLRFEDIPFEVIDKAKLCFLDTLGVALAGSVTPIGRLAKEFAVAVGGKGEATVFNYGDRISCVLAAYANGTMSFSHNFTDTTLSCAVHCGPVIMPAALSIAEKEGSTGKEVLEALIAGYEMMTGIGNVINSGPRRMSLHKRGFHATATTGVFGASLTASKLLGLSTDRVIDSLGIAGSYASGLLESVTSPESETYKTHTGIAAQNGITAAILAKLGLKGPHTVLEGKNGFFSVFGEKNSNYPIMDQDIGKKYLIMDSAFKLYNCAHVWAVPLDCLKGLMKKYKFRPEEVAEIKVIIPTMYSYVMDDSKGSNYPRSYAEAQNNLPYVMAAMILHNSVHIEQFNDRVLRDPRMKEMASKVTVEIDSSLDEVFKETDKAPAKIVITLKDGKKELFETLDYPQGSPKNPVAGNEIEGKFVNLAVNIIGKEKAKELVHMVGHLEELSNLGDLIGCLVV